jgi:glycopeptide antibiotics resistance protein
MASARQGFAAPLLLAATIALILYASLYPFRFAPDGPTQLEALRRITWGRASRGDMLNNLVLYLPLGFALSAWLAPRLGRLGCLLLAIVAGFLLSLSMELLQASIPLRVSSLRDLALNTAGSALGALGGWAWLLVGARMVPASATATRMRGLALTVIVLWLLARLWPLWPDIGLRQLKLAVRPLLDARLDLAEVGVFLLGWLIVAQAIFHLVKRARSVEALLLVIVVALVGRALMTGNQVEPAEITALVLMLPVLALASRIDERARCGLLALALATYLAWLALGPALLGDLAFGSPSRQLPRVLEAGTHPPAVLLLRSFQYLALGWLCAAAGVPARWTAVLLLAFVASLCLFQVPRIELGFAWVDGALALLAAVLLARSPAQAARSRSKG